MKSLLVNVLFPAWVWTKTPSNKFLCFSYAEGLTIRDSLKCRNLIGSRWYQDRFPLNIDPRNDQKAEFANTKGGYRMCFGTGGGIAGQGGDFLLIDDPLEISLGNSEATRNKVNFTYDNSISMRGNDPKTVKKVIIMQRLHEDDLCGHVLEKDEQWEKLIFPAEYDGVRFTSSIDISDPRTKVGELLWEDRIGETELRKMKSNLGSMGTAGQLQQRPAPLTGSIFKRAWFSNRVANLDIVARYISADTASSISANSAYTSFIVGELTSDYRLFIRFVKRDRYQFPDLISATKGLAQDWKHSLKGIVIESKSSGISALQTLGQASEAWISDILHGYTPTTDKIDRAMKAAIWCQNGSVIFPPPTEGFEWLSEFEDELFNFPNGKYKDQVDSFSQLVLYLEHYLSAGLEYREQGVPTQTLDLGAIL
jgi:predicted phage terminase large subunit-like protein